MRLRFCNGSGCYALSAAFDVKKGCINIKKYLYLLIAACVAWALLAGCAAEKNSAEAPAKTVDVDLSVLEGTVLTAEYQNITNRPLEYIGKTIKITATYAAYADSGGKYYTYVLGGGDACCAPLGIEFKWSGDHAYPGDYPERQAKIEITGVYGSYMESGQTLYYIDAGELKILQ